jgi:hypothetical protein
LSVIVLGLLSDMITIQNMIQRFFRTRYVGMLEEEVARLRGENRALLNSLLGTAGFPPVEFAEPVKPVELPRLRKRSWQQVQRKNELEAMKG